MKQILAEILEGAVQSASVTPSDGPSIHAVKTEGPLGDVLKSLLPDSSTPPYVSTLTQLVSKKYQLILAYIHYGDQLRSFARDGIFGHFQEHLDEERDQLYQLNKKLTALGSDAPCAPEQVPPVQLNDLKALFSSLQKLELESVQLWSQLFQQTSDDVALNGMAQAYATECQGHADDMARYLRSCE